MTTLIASLRKQLSWLDAILIATGVLGLVAFFLLLPPQHPDSTVQLTFNDDEITENLRQYVNHTGFIIPTGIQPEVQLRRDSGLLSTLQSEMGRPETVRFLAEEGHRFPTYYWHVDWARESEGDRTELFTVSASLDGRVFRFQSDPSRIPAMRVNQAAIDEALNIVLTPGDSVISVAGIPDSTIHSQLSFELSDTTRFGGPSPADTTLTSVSDTSFVENLRAGISTHVGSDVAVAYARHHLRQSVFENTVFEVDSISASTRPGVDAASVYLHSESPFLGQQVNTVLTVTVTGLLLDLTSTFYEATPSQMRERVAGQGEDSGVSFDYPGDDFWGILTVLAYAFLVLLIMILFARRLSARVVDTKSALQDALWGGFIAAGVVLMAFTRPIFHDVQSVWISILIILVAFGFSGSFAAFLVFMASGAMDSLARSVWAEKLATLDSVRHGLFRSVPVGAALLRGLFIAFFLVGGLTVLLVLFPGAGIENESIFAGYELVNVAGFAITKSAWVSLFLNLTVMLGIGTMLYQLKPNPWVVISGIVVSLVLLDVTVVSISAAWVSVLSSVFVGLILATAFWRYDYVTSVTAYAVLGILWITKNGWMIESSPEAFNTLLTFVVLGIVGCVGFVGLLSRRTATEIPDFTPDYVRELAKEERVKGELEIAYQVQAYLLPRKMPNVDGVDLAGMCLPALNVGGDYYDFIELTPGRLAIVVGDVSGKGIQAAFYMTLTKGIIQSLARIKHSPAEVMRHLNHLFYENVPRGTFISMIYGIIDVDARTFTFARAGHNPIIFRRAPSQQPEIFRPDGLGIGLVSGPLFDDTIIEEVIHLNAGDVLVFYTDGFSEAMNTSKQLYGDDRLAKRVGDVGHRSANEILRAVSEDVHHFVEAAGRHDDMTMIVVKMIGKMRATTSKSIAVEGIDIM